MMFKIFPCLMCKPIYKCPRGVMDNTEDSGSSAGGSIPSEGAILLFKIPIYNMRKPCKH